MLKLKLVSVYILLFLISSLDADFKSRSYNYYSSKIMEEAALAGSDIRECRQAISKIEDGDDQSWTSAWLKVAFAVEKEAYNFRSKGNFASAGETFLRASNYYRAAAIFVNRRGEESKFKDLSKRASLLFKLFAKYHTLPILEVKIPYEGKRLPGFLCQNGKGKKIAPLLVIQMGLDGTKEEAYYEFASYAVKRGYNCLLFDGPGQGEARAVLRIPFRYDWERVIAPVVDFAFSLNCADKEKVALVGIGLGAHLSARAMAFETRLKAGVLIGGMRNFHAMVMDKKIAEEDLDSLEKAKILDESIEERLRKDGDLRLLYNQGLYSFMACSPSDWLKKTRLFNLEAVISGIKGKILVAGAEGALKREGEIRALNVGLVCDKSCIPCAKAFSISNATILDWLDDNL